MLKAFALQTKKRSLGLKMSFILKKKEINKNNHSFDFYLFRSGIIITFDF